MHGVPCALGSIRLCPALQKAKWQPDMPKEVSGTTQGTLPLLGWVLFLAPTWAPVQALRQGPVRRNNATVFLTAGGEV